MSDVTQDYGAILVSPECKLAVAVTKHYGKPFAGNAVFDEELMRLIDDYRIAAEKAVLDRAWSLVGSDGLLEVELLERALETKP